MGFLTGPSQISCYSFQQWLPVGYPSCLPDSCSAQPDTCPGILARLVGGATSEEGNLQVFYNGTWGMVRFESVELNIIVILMFECRCVIDIGRYWMLM